MSKISLNARDILDDVEKLKKCGDNYVDIYDQFCRIINDLKSNQTLSSNMLDQRMENTLEEMGRVTKVLKNHCNVFTSFLKEDIVSGYEAIDRESAKKFDINEGKRLVGSDE